MQIPPLDKMSDEELVALAGLGNDEATGLLIARFLPLVRSKATSYYGPGMEPDDLEQEGMMGLWSAVRHYDPTRGGKFSTYATLCVTNRILSAVKSALSLKHSPLRDYMSISPGEDGQNIQIPFGEQPESSFIAKETTELHDRKIKQVLSDYEQQVLELYISGHTYREISQAVRSTPKAVDNALQRVRRKLKEK